MFWEVSPPFPDAGLVISDLSLSSSRAWRAADSRSWASVIPPSSHFTNSYCRLIVQWAPRPKASRLFSRCVSTSMLLPTFPWANRSSAWLMVITSCWSEALIPGITTCLLYCVKSGGRLCLSIPQAVPAAVTRLRFISWRDLEESAPGHLFHTARSRLSSSKRPVSPTSNELEDELEDVVPKLPLLLPLSFFFLLLRSFFAILRALLTIFDLTLTLGSMPVPPKTSAKVLWPTSLLSSSHLGDLLGLPSSASSLLFLFASFLSTVLAFLPASSILACSRRSSCRSSPPSSLLVASLRFLIQLSSIRLTSSNLPECTKSSSVSCWLQSTVHRCTATSLSFLPLKILKRSSSRVQEPLAIFTSDAFHLSCQLHLPPIIHCLWEVDWPESRQRLGVQVWKRLQLRQDLLLLLLLRFLSGRSSKGSSRWCRPPQGPSFRRHPSVSGACRAFYWKALAFLFSPVLYLWTRSTWRDRSPATPPSTPSPALGVEGDQVPGGTSDGPPDDQGAGQVALTSSFSLFLLLAFLPQNPILLSSFDLCHGSSSLFDGSCFPSGDSCFFLAWETCLLPFSSLWILLDDSFRCWLPLASPLQFWINSLVSFSGSFSSLGGWNSSALMSCLGGLAVPPWEWGSISLLSCSPPCPPSAQPPLSKAGRVASPVDGVPVAPLVTTGGGPSLWSSSLKSASKVRAAANAKPMKPGCVWPIETR